MLAIETTGKDHSDYIMRQFSPNKSLVDSGHLGGCELPLQSFITIQSKLFKLVHRR